MLTRTLFTYQVLTGLIMSNNNGFSKSILGNVLAGLIVAVCSAAAGWVISRITYEAPPLPVPTVQLAPDKIVAPVSDPIQFSSAGTQSPNTQPTLEWRIGGLNPDESPVANCSGTGELLQCRFLLPGTFAVSLKVTDTNGRSGEKSSIVTIKVPGGYLGLVSTIDDAAQQRALLYGVDWNKLQSVSPRPIVLFDPDRNAPVYASMVRKPAGTPEPPPWRGAAKGQKIAIPTLSYQARTVFEEELLKIGVVLISMPAGEIATAAQRGLAELGLIPIDSPQAITRVF